MQRTRRFAAPARSLVLLASTALAASCIPTTEIVAEWTKPNMGPVTIEHPMVVFQYPDEALRRSVEDALAQSIPGAVPAYQILSKDEVENVDVVRQKVRDAGFKSVIVVRFVGVRNELHWEPSPAMPAYGPVWGAWGYGWATASPGYFDTTRVVSLETLIYSLSASVDGGTGDLIWASHSETFDPQSVRQLAQSLVRASVRQMEDDGIVVPGAPAKPA